jgi:hypothetical protein
MGLGVTPKHLGSIVGSVVFDPALAKGLCLIH